MRGPAGDEDSDSRGSEPGWAGEDVEHEGSRKKARVEKSHMGMASREPDELQGLSVAEQEALALKLLSGK